MRNLIKCVRTINSWTSVTSASVVLRTSPILAQSKNFQVSFARRCFSSSDQVHLSDKRNDSIVRFESEMSTLFPNCEEEIKHLVDTAPEVLHYSTDKIHQYASIFLKHGDKQPLRPGDAIKLFAICPDILNQSYSDVETSVVYLLMRCAKFDLPWSSIFLENVDLVFQDNMIIPDMVFNLTSYSQFNSSELFFLVLNNPQIFRLPWPIVQKKVKFLLEVMNVSLKSISMTQNSLTVDLDFYEFRYKFLKLSGNYKHPSMSQLGSRLMEAEPSLKLICETDDADFLRMCAPQISLEELNAFKTLHYMEQNEMFDIFEEDEDLIDQENYYRLEDDTFSGSYGKKIKGGIKTAARKKKAKEKTNI